MTRKESEPWEMHPEQRALIGDLSGNATNGLGETGSRRPSMTYWPNDLNRGDATDNSQHPFADVIRWFRKRSPATHHIYTDFKSRAPRVLDPVAAATEDLSISLLYATKVRPLDRDTLREVADGEEVAVQLVEEDLDA